MKPLKGNGAKSPHVLQADGSTGATQMPALLQKDWFLVQSAHNGVCYSNRPGWAGVPRGPGSCQEARAAVGKWPGLSKLLLVFLPSRLGFVLECHLLVHTY